MPTSYVGSLKIYITRPRAQSCLLAAQEIGLGLQLKSEGYLLSSTLFNICLERSIYEPLDEHRRTAFNQFSPDVNAEEEKADAQVEHPDIAATRLN